MDRLLVDHAVTGLKAVAPAEIEVALGVKDFILTYSSEQRLAYRDTGLQHWDIGLHPDGGGDGPEAPIGSISLVTVEDHCPDPVLALDDLSRDLLQVGEALYEPGERILRDDLWEQLEMPGGRVVIVDQVRIDPRLRGHGLGVYLAGAALDYVARECGVIALFPGPLEATDVPREEAYPRLRKAWSRIGFRPYRNGVWIVDPGLLTLRECLRNERDRLSGHRWRIVFRQADNEWGEEIASIAPEPMSKSLPRPVAGAVD